jgi:hypothetical protein
MSDPTNKAELLTRLDDGHAAFEALLAPLSEAQLTASGVNGDWSIKDILVHLTTWQGRASQRFVAAQSGEQPQLDPPIQTEEEMNAFNDRTFAANQSRLLNEVQRDFHATYQRFRANIAALSDKDLFETDRFPWMQGSPLWQLAEGDGYGHYREHGPVIVAWLAR